MKSLILAFLILNSASSLCREVKGSWSSCEVDPDGTSFEHYVLFDQNNVEFEVNTFFGGEDQPCLTNPEISISRFWYYELDQGTIKSTLFSTTVVLSSEDMIGVFNDMKVCGNSNWMLGEKIECNNYDQRMFSKKRGYKAEVDYKIVNDELHVTSKSGTYIYKKKDLVRQ